jgi:hypothetical protein
MYYWNKENFEGLLEIAEALKNKNGYEYFAEYCLLREKGLNKPAVKAIREFVVQISKTDLQNQRSVAVDLAQLAYWRRDVHQIMSHPLKVFITDVLKGWCLTESTELPFTWLGYMTGNQNYYIKALEQNSKDQVALTRLAYSALDDVDYQTHHLCETLFLGHEKDATASLRQANTYIENLEESDIKNRLEAELKEYEELITAWVEFSSNEHRMKKESFPKWSFQNGNNFNFGSIYYYDK